MDEIPADGITRWVCLARFACNGGVWQTRRGTSRDRVRPSICRECRHEFRRRLYAGELLIETPAPDNVRRLATLRR